MIGVNTFGNAHDLKVLTRDENHCETQFYIPDGGMHHPRAPHPFSAALCSANINNAPSPSPICSSLPQATIFFVHCNLAIPQSYLLQLHFKCSLRTFYPVSDQRTTTNLLLRARSRTVTCNEYQRRLFLRPSMAPTTRRQSR
jgi:hypothetical protein